MPGTAPPSAPPSSAGCSAVLLAAEGVTSTGYRFARYCTGDEPYVRKGPPPTFLRLLAPVLELPARAAAPGSEGIPSEPQSPLSVTEET